MASNDADPPVVDGRSRCVRCVVSGRVQGVAFRASACERARALHVTGWVRNRADGSVEVVACGQPGSLAAFRGWLQEGPRYAKVLGLDCAPHPFEEFAEFSVRR